MTKLPNGDLVLNKDEQRRVSNILQGWTEYCELDGCGLDEEEEKTINEFNSD